jgi:hypothetical protein
MSPPDDTKLSQLPCPRWRQLALRAEAATLRRLRSGVVRTFGRCRSSAEVDPQSTLIPAAFTTLPHFSVSSAINLANSVGERGRTVAPRLANRFFIVGSARAAFISLLSLSTIPTDVFFGVTIPNQTLASKPGTKSAITGISGSASERLASPQPCSRSRRSAETRWMSPHPWCCRTQAQVS